MGDYAKGTVGGRRTTKHRAVLGLGKGSLGSKMIVHHKDGNKANDAPGNLAMISRAKHNTITHLKHPKTKRCPSCGKTFTPAPTHRLRAVTCGSKACISRYLSRAKSKR